MENGWLREIYVGVASIAGAITALSFKKWQAMSSIEVVFGLLVGASFAWFVTPLIVEKIASPSPENVRITAGLTYLVAAGSNVIMPLMIGQLRKRLGLDGDDK